MDHVNTIEPVTVLKTRSADLIRRAQKSGQPIIITQTAKLPRYCKTSSPISASGTLSCC